MLRLIVVLAAFCSAEGSSEWTPVFHGTAGLKSSIYNLWVSNAVKPLPPLKQNMAKKETQHYKSALVEAWSKLCVESVLLAFYKNGKIAAYVEFDGLGSTKTNWLTFDRVRWSSWSDFPSSLGTTCTPGCYVTMRGTMDTGDRNGKFRRFYINKLHRGCPNDMGWLLVAEMGDPNDVCPWMQRYSNRWPVLVYSTGRTAVNYHRGNPGEADTMAIFIKRSNICGTGTS